MCRGWWISDCEPCQFPPPGSDRASGAAVARTSCRTKYSETFTFNYILLGPVHTERKRRLYLLFAAYILIFSDGSFSLSLGVNRPYIFFLKLGQLSTMIQPSELINNSSFLTVQRMFSMTSLTMSIDDVRPVEGTEEW